MDLKPDDNDDNAKRPSNAKFEELQNIVEELYQNLAAEREKRFELQRELQRAKELFTSPTQRLTKLSFPVGWLDDNSVRKAVIGNVMEVTEVVMVVFRMS